MPLSFISNDGNDWLPHIRYMAGTASWVYADKTSFQFTKAAFDLGRIETGWCLLAENQTPQWVMDESIEKTAPRPDGDGWKRGFKVNIMSKQMFGEESPIREWGTNGTGATMAIQKLFTDWEEMKPTDNQVAIVEYAGATPTKVGKGNTNVPTLNILKLIDRPAELEDIGSAGADAGATSSPDTASAATEDDDEFI